MKHTISEIQISYYPKNLDSNLVVSSSNFAYEVIRNNWNLNTLELYEEFKVLLINNSNIPLGIFTVSRGGITSTLVDLRILFSVILKSCATSFITVHNHPSGKLKPSVSDINLHKKIKELAQLHDVNYLDNLIITKEEMYSFADEGKM